jgi:hypothetical protein
MKNLNNTKFRHMPSQYSFIWVFFSYIRQLNYYLMKHLRNNLSKVFANLNIFLLLNNHLVIELPYPLLLPIDNNINGLLFIKCFVIWVYLLIFYIKMKLFLIMKHLLMLKLFRKFFRTFYISNKIESFSCLIFYIMFMPYKDNWGRLILDLNRCINNLFI